MLADPRATDALVDDFAAQWLNLRRVEEVVVDPERYPNYDQSLLQAFQQETELFVGSTHPRGSQRRRSAERRLHVRQRTAGAALRHSRASTAAASAASRFPTTISAAGCSRKARCWRPRRIPDRTSPVLRGKWLLNNIFGLPVPPPPPGVDTNLTENKPGAPPTSIRERLAQHRQNPSCNSCHSVIDPLGFALENFDVIGGWRTVDESGKPVDASGTTVERREGRRAGGTAGAAARAARAVSAHGHRKAAGLRARPAARVLRSAGGAQDRPRRGGARLPLVVAHSRDREEPGVPDAGIARRHRTDAGDRQT